MAQFTAIPDLPSTQMPVWEYRTLTAVKENIDLLLGLRGGASNRVVLQKSLDQISGSLPTITAIDAISIADIASTTVTGVDGSSQTVIRWDAGGWQSIPTTLAQCGTAADLEKIKADIANLRAAIEAISTQLGAG